MLLLLLFEKFVINKIETLVRCIAILLVKLKGKVMFRKNKIILSVWIISFLSVNLSASSKLSKQELSAFMAIMTNYIMEEDKQAPVFITSSSITVEENQNYAYRVRVSDASSVHFSLAGKDAAYFNMNTSSGVITFKHTPNYATKNTYTFIIRATDSNHNRSSQSVTIHIKNPALYKPKKTGAIEVNYKYDDGYYRKGLAQSYTRNNATGIVTDTVTKLQWQDDARIKTVYTQSINTAINYCKNLNLDGRGWRLPTIQELNTIIMRGKPAPSLHSRFRNYLSNDISGIYISSTQIADGLGLYSWFIYYWGINNNGDLTYIATDRETNNFYMRCVR